MRDSALTMARDSPSSMAEWTLGARWRLQHLASCAGQAWVWVQYQTCLDIVSSTLLGEFVRERKLMTALPNEAMTAADATSRNHLLLPRY